MNNSFNPRSSRTCEWLPWLNGEIEAGRLEVKRSQANTYMRVASNYQRAGNLEGVTSIRAALELLSDKEPEEQQGTLIDVEAERQAREAAEAKAEALRQPRLDLLDLLAQHLNRRNATMLAVFRFAPVEKLITFGNRETGYLNVVIKPNNFTTS